MFVEKMTVFDRNKIIVSLLDEIEIVIEERILRRQSE